MRIVLPVAALVTLFAGVSIASAIDSAPPVERTVPARTAPPHAVKASMPLIPPRFTAVR